MRVKCPRCGGTGNMGVLTSSRCRVCRGSGFLELESHHEALYEWLEGFLDSDTDEKWLEDQLRRLMEHREEFLSKKGG